MVLPLGRKSKEDDLSSTENSRTSVYSDADETNETIPQEQPRSSGSNIISSKAPPLIVHSNSGSNTRLENGYTNSSSSSLRSSTSTTNTVTPTMTTNPSTTSTTTILPPTSNSLSSQSNSFVPINLPITGPGVFRISSTFPNNNNTTTNNQDNRGTLTITKTSAPLSRNTTSTS